MVIRKPRSDKGVKRIVRLQEPRLFHVQMIPDDAIEGGIVKALDKDLARMKKKNPSATIKTVLVDWLGKYLGLIEENES